MSFKPLHILSFIILLPSFAMAMTFPLPPKGDDMVGHIQTIKVKPGQSVVDIAKKYQIGYLELYETNPKVNFNDLWAGTKLVIPTRYILPDVPRKGIVINLAELRLYYFPPDQSVVMTYPVGIGKKGETTPVMKGSIVEKIVDPEWHPTKLTRETALMRGIVLPSVVESGPDNPLGYFAMRLSDPLFLIHGTNDSTGVGKRVSGGCIRMFNDNVEELFHHVKVGTPVDIIDEPFKAGWYHDQLYLESHMPVDYSETKEKHVVTPAVIVISHALKKRQADINWDHALNVANQQNGIPAVIGHSLHTS